MTRYAIIGTGLIGTSIGLKLREKPDRGDMEIVGADREYGRARRARKLGALDLAVRDPREAVRDASMVILATPVLALRRLMQDIAPVLGEGAVITDTGSTKSEVMAWAAQELPDSVHFVGGHPMAGKTDDGPDAAEASLFEGARWVIVPSPRASERAVKAVGALVERVGATATFMDAEEHDSYVAAISHLPMVASFAAFSLVRDSEAWPELAGLAAGGFDGATRLAGTEPNVAHDIVATNRAQIVHWIERYREVLRELQDRIADEDDEAELFRYLAQANLDYAAYQNGEVERKETGEVKGELGARLADLLIGGAAAGKIREISERNEERAAEAEHRRLTTRREE